MTINAAALKKLTVARSQLLLNKGHGFWGVLALRLKLKEDPSCRTLAVDGKHVFYNPEFVLGLTDSLCRSAMAHEVMHCVFDHMRRRGSRNPKKWNYAGDYAINLVLEEAGFEIGAGWLIDKAYAGLSADEIYMRLPDPPDEGGNDTP
jgi:predicted metal-dependent peptidase